MQEVKIALEEFDLKGFISQLLDFVTRKGNSELHPTRYTYWVNEVGDVPQEWPDDFVPDLEKELVLNGKLIFLTFSMSNVGRPIPCADGNSYLLNDDEEEWVEDDDEESEGVDENEGEETESRESLQESILSLGETDVVGFLLRHNDGTLTVNPAVHSFAWPPPPMLETVEDCDVFDVPMYQFVRRFMK